MLSRANRLTGEANYKEVKTKGRVFQSDLFGLAFLQRRDSLPSKFGVIVSNRISKKAVQRNKIKRIIRAAVKENLDKIKEGFNIVFLAKQKLVERKPKDIVSEVKNSLLKSGLVK